MPRFLFSNFGSAQLELPVAVDDPILTVKEMQGNLFPSPNPDQGERFSLVLRKPDGTPEVMHCWKRETDILHVLRGRENTDAQAWDVDEWVSLRTTAEALNDWAQADVGAFVADDEHYFEVESLTISEDHVFVDEAERDTYFGDNPGELVDGVAIIMSSGFYVYDEGDDEWVNTPARDNYFELFPEELVSGLPIWMDGDLQVWDAVSEAWRYVTAYIQGPMGPVGDVTQDVIDARDEALGSIEAARVGAIDEMQGILSEAEAARDTALSGANFAGHWSSLAGALDMPASVAHDGKFWALAEPITGDPGDEVEDHEPGVSVKWIEIVTVKELQIETGTATSIEGLSFVVPVTVSAFGFTDKDALRLKVQYREVGTGSWTDTAEQGVTDIGVTNFTVTGLTPETAYEFRPVATDALNPEVEVIDASGTATTTDEYVSQPTLTVEGEPSDVLETPILTTSAFAVNAGSDTHAATDWWAEDSGGNVVWESMADASNLESIVVDGGVLADKSDYTFFAVHRGAAYGPSTAASSAITTNFLAWYFNDANIGQPLAGGNFGARMAPGGGNILYALVVPPKASGESSSALAWKDANTATVGTGNPYSIWDGLRNTHSMTVAAGTHAAGAYTWALDINGYTDWYLPARNELEPLYRNFKRDATANDTSSGANPDAEPRTANYTAGDPTMTTVAAYQAAGAESFDGAHYWSSSEYGEMIARRQNFFNGEQNSSNKTNTFRVRAVRRLPLYPFDSLWFGDLVEAQGGYWGGNIWDGVRTTVLGDTMTSTTSLTVGTGEKTVTVAGTDLLTPTLWVGRKLRFVATGRNRSNAAWMQGKITDVNTSTREVTIDCERVLGSGTFTAWALVAGQALIVSPKSWGDVGTFAWKDADTSGPVETQTLTNGPAATAAMIALGATTYPAAAQIAAMNDYDGGNGRGGFADWYMPSRDELQAIGYNLCPTLAGWPQNTARAADVTYSRDGNIDDYSSTAQTSWHADPLIDVSAPVGQTHVAAFKVGGTECFGPVYYWSSSESSFGSGWFLGFDQGYQSPGWKTGLRRVRAVRRLAI